MELQQLSPQTASVNPADIVAEHENLVDEAKGLLENEKTENGFKKHLKDLSKIKNNALKAGQYYDVLRWVYLNRKIRNCWLYPPIYRVAFACPLSKRRRKRGLFSIFKKVANSVGKAVTRSKVPNLPGQTSSNIWRRGIRTTWRNIFTRFMTFHY